MMTGAPPPMNGEPVPMKIVIATDNYFWRRQIGSQVRISSLYRHFATSGWDVTILFVGELHPADLQIFALMDPPLRIVNHETGFGEWRHQESFGQKLKKTIPIPVKQALKQLVRRIAKWGSQSGDADGPTGYGERKLADYARPQYRSLFRELCRVARPDAVLIEYVRLSYLMEGAREVLPAHTVTMVDTHDVMHERQLRFHQHGEPHEIDISGAEEAAALAKFDYVLAIQKLDAVKFRALVPGRNVIVVGHPHPVVCLPVRTEGILRVIFVGSHSPPNRRALDAFLAEIWPRLWQLFPDRISLTVYGGICRTYAAIPDVPGVRFAGFADDLDEVYRNSDVVVNPVAFGGGLKIKSVEALCYSRPLVTTPIGAEGLEHGAGDAFIVYDTNDQAVQAISELIERPARREELAAKAHSFALENFEERHVYGELDAAVMSRNMPERGIARRGPVR